MSSVYDQLIRASMISILRFDWNKDVNIKYHTDILECLKSEKYDKGREELVNHVNIWTNAINEVKNKVETDL